MKKIHIILLSIFFICASFGLSSAATYTIKDPALADWQNILVWSHWDTVAVTWDPQQQTWSQGVMIGNFGPSGRIGNIVSSDGNIGEKVNVELTYNYAITWSNSSMGRNSDNYVGADEFDIYADFYFGIRNFVLGGTDVLYENTLLHAYTGSMTISFEAETGSYLNEGFNAAGQHNNPHISGIHLYDYSLYTRVAWDIRSDIVFDSYSITPVPEPATLLFLGLGLIGLAGVKRKFKK